MHLDYPGPSSTHAGNIGAESYVAGRSFGVRITHIPGHKFRLEHLVDALPEGRHVDLSEQDLPDGSFGFEFCCNRSFPVDDVVIEASSPGADDTQNDTAGPYVATTRNGAAEVFVPEDHPGAFRRSIYLQQRRSQGLSLLNVFDAPMMVVNCTHRPVTTMPLQSLSLLNSDFAVKRGQSFAERIHREAGESAESRVRRAFVLATGHECSDQELLDTLQFIQDQRKGYSGEGDTVESRVWAEFCQLLLASNACLYLE